MPGGADELQRLVVRDAGVAQMDGEGAEHVAMVGDQRNRPAGPQAVAQGEVTVFVPERVLADVPAHHHLPAEHRSAAGAGQGAYGQAVECLVVGFRQAGRGARQQALVLGVHQQDGAEGSGLQGLAHQADGLEDVRQRLVGGDHAEDVALVLGVGLVADQAGDVVGDGEEGSLAFQPARRPEQVDQAAILALAAVAQRVPGLALDDGLDVAAGAFAVLGQDELDIAAADHLLGPVAEHAVAGRADLGEALGFVHGAEHVHGVVHDPLVLQLQPGLVLQAQFQLAVALAQPLAALDGQARKPLADHQEEGEAQPEEHEQRRQVDGGVIGARQGLVSAHAPASLGAEVGALLAHRVEAARLAAGPRVVDALGTFEDFQDETVEPLAQLAVKGGADVQAGDQQCGGLPGDSQGGGHQRAVVIGNEALRRAHLRPAALAHPLQPVAQWVLGEEARQPAVGLVVAPGLQDGFQPGVEHGDQVEVGEVAQVAAGLLLPERFRRHALEALPALGHALHQLQAHGQGVLDGGLGAQQQLLAVGIEGGQLVEAEQEPAEAGGQRAEPAGDQAAPVEQVPAVLRQGAEHQHGGAEQCDEEVGDMPGFRAEGETRQVVARGQQGQLRKQGQADQGDAAKLAEPAPALAGHGQDHGQAEQAADDRQLAAHPPVAADQRMAVVAAAGQDVVPEVVAGQGDQCQAGQQRALVQAAGRGQQGGAGAEGEDGAVGHQHQVLAGGPGQGEKGGQADAAQGRQGEGQAVEVGLEDDVAVVGGHGFAPFRWRVLS
ncbi:hypothetical protein D9M69_316330 [compost metagenome]